MTEIDERVRDLLREMAKEMPRTPMLTRLDRQAQLVRWRLRLVVASAAVTVLIVALGVALLTRHPSTTEPLPAEQPPEVFRLSQTTTPHPGVAAIAVTLARGANQLDAPAYIVPAAGGPALTVRGGSYVNPGMQRLSADGTMLLRGSNGFDHSTVLLDLRTGEKHSYVFGDGLVNSFSPDNQRIASYIDRGVLVANITTGRTDKVPTAGTAAERGGLGWSPDGKLLALHEPGSTRIVNSGGTTVVRLSEFSLVNGSMSWSPSGRYLLGYDDVRGSYELATSDGRQRHPVTSPTDATRLLGWAGPHLVWLTGGAGAQRLVMTDDNGHHPATWMRFPKVLPALESITWSRALSGAATP